MEKFSYFKNREDNIAHAKVILDWAKNTNIGGTDYFDRESLTVPEYYKKKNNEYVELSSNDTVTELFRHVTYLGRICVLNFASFTNPGGKFLEGSMAQEEALCHSSNLYMYLKNLEDSYYCYNRKRENKAFGLYRDKALYCKNVLFVNKNDAESLRNATTWQDQLDINPQNFMTKMADVLTIAAPNINAIEYNIKNGIIEDDFVKKYNSFHLERRIRFIKDIMIYKKVDLAILGAWGCGVFKQDPIEVARLFKEIFKGSGIDQIYAVPNSFHNKNYEAFKYVIENE